MTHLHFGSLREGVGFAFRTYGTAVRRAALSVPGSVLMVHVLLVLHLYARTPYLTFVTLHGHYNSKFLEAD